MTTWQAVHKQTKEVFKGTERQVLDLDYRVWGNKQEVEETKSHNVIIESKPLAYVKTYLACNTSFYCMAGIFTMPVYQLTDLARK